MITISVITPTFRREHLLARCVESVLSQQVEEARIEHIIVNDAGEPLTYAAWMDDPRVRVVETDHTERAVARNTGAALSRGQWLYFLDDDDYALSDAFEALLSVARNTSAVQIYGGYRIYNESTGTVQTIRPTLEGNAFPALVAGEAFPPPSSWVRRDAFFATGGFDPLMVPGEDADLFRRLALYGQIAGTSFIVTAARVAHPHTSTTDTNRQHGLWQRGTEKVLDLPQTLTRLLQETRHASYWRGRCAREYSASALRQIRRGRYMTAASRFSAACRLCFRHLFSPQYWQGLRRHEIVPRSQSILAPQETLLITLPFVTSESTIPAVAKTEKESLPVESPR